MKLPFGHLHNLLVLAFADFERILEECRPLVGTHERGWGIRRWADEVERGRSNDRTL